MRNLAHALPQDCFLLITDVFEISLAIYKSYVISTKKKQGEASLAFSLTVSLVVVFLRSI